MKEFSLFCGHKVVVEGNKGGVVWCGVARCSVVWFGVVWCIVVWCGVVWCGVVWCGLVSCGEVWYSDVGHGVDKVFRLKFL